MKLFASIILKLCGWKFKGIVPDAKKSIFIMAPHTSSWDFILGRLLLWNKGIKTKFLIKQEFFFFPIKSLMKKMGGVSINREQSKNAIKYCVELFDHYPEISLVITPEGTRQYTDHWKKGFYFIAEQAHVPIFIGFLDYKKKEGGILAEFKPSGDFEKDILLIQAYYKGITAKYPEKFNVK